MLLLLGLRYEWRLCLDVIFIIRHKRRLLLFKVDNGLVDFLFFVFGFGLLLLLVFFHSLLVEGPEIFFRKLHQLLLQFRTALEQCCCYQFEFFVFCLVHVTRCVLAETLACWYGLLGGSRHWWGLLLDDRYWLNLLGLLLHELVMGCLGDRWLLGWCRLFDNYRLKFFSLGLFKSTGFELVCQVLVNVQDLSFWCILNQLCPIWVRFK